MMLQPNANRRATVAFATLITCGLLVPSVRGNYQETTPPAERPSKPVQGTAKNQDQDQDKAKKKSQPEKPEDVEQVRQRLHGDWNLIAGVNQGHKLSPKELEGSHAIINDNTIVVLDTQEKELYKASFELEVSMDDKPHRLNMSSDNPNASKAVAFGILQFTKEGWKLAYGLPGTERPKDFVSPTGSKIMLFEVVAAKKKEPLIPKDSNLPEVE